MWILFYHLSSDIRFFDVFFWNHLAIWHTFFVEMIYVYTSNEFTFFFFFIWLPICLPLCIIVSDRLKKRKISLRKFLATWIKSLLEWSPFCSDPSHKEHDGKCFWFVLCNTCSYIRVTHLFIHCTCIILFLWWQLFLISKYN